VHCCIMCHANILDSFCPVHKTGRREDHARPGKRDGLRVSLPDESFAQTFTILYVQSTKLGGRRSL
jgi:hypothetical protein